MSPNPTNLAANLIIEECKKLINESTSPSIFNAHHRVEIVYPSLELLQGAEIIHIPAALDSQHRYNPTQPLVPDLAVTDHAGRNSLKEVQFASIYETDRQFDGLRPLDNLGLREDMDWCTRFVGRTILHVLWYRTQAADMFPRLRVHRVTKFRGEGGDEYDHNQRYEIPGSAQLDEMFGDFKPDWYLHVTDLLMRASDQAAKAVRYQLRRDEARFEYFFEQDETNWKPKRQPEYVAVLDQFVTAGHWNITEECPIHLEEFGPNHRPVHVPCSLKHILCRDALLEICIAEGAEARCPQDRIPFFNEAQKARLKYGEINGIFYADERYTSWENFQSSCSDLDKNLASSSDETLIVRNPFMVFDLWLYLFKKDMRGEEKHLPENRSVMLAIESGLREIAEKRMTAKYVHRWLHRAIFQRLVLDFFGGNAATFAKVYETDYVVDHPSHNNALRPGYIELIERSLNRICNFLDLRYCLETGHGNARHMHGDRLFYNADAYDDVAKKEGKELYKTLEERVVEVEEREVDSVEKRKAKEARRAIKERERVWKGKGRVSSGGRVEKRSSRSSRGRE